MKKYGVTPDLETLKSFVVSRLLPLGVDPEYLADRLVAAGMRSKDVILTFDVYYLEHDQMHIALQRGTVPYALPYTQSLRRRAREVGSTAVGVSINRPARLLSASRPRFEGSTELVNALTNCYLRTGDHQSMVSFMKVLESDKVTMTDWIGEVLLDVYTKSPAMGEALIKVNIS